MKRPIIALSFTVALAVAASVVAFAEAYPEQKISFAASNIVPLALPKLVFAENVAMDEQRRGELLKGEIAANEARSIAPRRLRAILTSLDVEVALNGGTFNRKALQLLELSYSLSRFDFTYGQNRLIFAYNRWQSLSSAARSLVYNETSCLQSGAPDRMVAVTRGVTNKLGKFALTLNVRRILREPRTCS